jgi:hypothetical protein
MGLRVWVVEEQTHAHVPVGFSFETVNKPIGTEIDLNSYPKGPFVCYGFKTCLFLFLTQIEWIQLVHSNLMNLRYHGHDSIQRI